MKRLILIFIFVSGINLFAQANFYLEIYKGKANYLKGYNQYLPSNYYIFNYRLYIIDGVNHYECKKEYIYNYTNKKMYLLKDYYWYYYYYNSYNLKRGTEEKFYDLNGKRREGGYSFAKRTVKGTNRYGEEVVEYDDYFKYNNSSLTIFNSWSIQSYENSLKLPNVINPKNIGLYDIGINNYDGFSYRENSGLLALGSEYQIYSLSYSDSGFDYDCSGYDYSGKDYILETSYIIDLETKSKININGISKEEYEKELNKETEEMKSQISEKEKIIDKRQSELPYLIQEVDSFNNNKDSWIKNRANFYIKNEKRKKEEANTMATNDWEDNLLYKENRRDNVKNEIEKLENEIKELEKSIEELENIYKNRKNSELENKYIKIFREKLPELEDEYYYLGENSITTNSINFIPFKYLKPYFERDNIKTKEQFYKLINFENEK
ncbi:hypothetical protein [Brachyspira aalborgi]|uniref:hypothetical protein n=1 Tax=Brachyspira aalborgi TaxID=29522 RepID=UPI00266D9039|nr:hypothetical protein [Brachyspira aalborgi]